MSTECIKAKIPKVAHIIAVETCKKYFRVEHIEDVAQEIALDLLERLSKDGTKMPATKWAGWNALRRTMRTRMVRGATYYGAIPNGLIGDTSWIKMGSIRPVSAEALIAVAKLQQVLPLLTAEERQILADYVEGEKQSKKQKIKAAKMLILLMDSKHKRVI